MKRRGICGMKTSISKKNPYWVSKHRFLELYHFCLQYKDYVSELQSITVQSVNDIKDHDPTGETAVRLNILKKSIDLIEKCCRDADSALWHFIFLGVTEGYSYNTLRTKFHIPCGKDYYFERYRKFFWFLSQRR